MPGFNIQVSVSETLEVRSGPLTEVEIWALLCQGAEALQDLFLTGNGISDDGPTFAITPDTFMLSASGRIQFAESSFVSIKRKDCIPPEYSAQQLLSELDVEKMYVFALGMTLYSSADFKLAEDEELKISEALDTVLGGMCEEDAKHRLTLMDILEVCAQQRQLDTSRLSNSYYISRLYKLVLGSDEELDYSYQEVENAGQRPRRTKFRTRSSRRESYKSRSRSRSYSRSRSRSRSRERPSYRRERPHSRRRDFESDTKNRRPASKTYSMSSKSSSKNYNTDFLQVPGADLPTQTVMPLWANTGERKVLGDIQPTYASQTLPSSMGRKTPSIRSGYLEANRLAELQKFQSLRDPHKRRSVQTTYIRLKDRQRRLNALRLGMDCDDMECSDLMSMMSGTTDFGERRSRMSAGTYIQGEYHPDMYSQYGSQVGLRMASDLVGLDRSDSCLSDESTWIERQKKETTELQNRKGTKASKPEVPYARAELVLSPVTKTTRLKQPSPANIQTSLPSKKRPPPNRTPRKFYGPEFVNVDSVVTLQVPEAKSATANSKRQLRVVLLNGQKLDVLCETNTTGQQLLETIVLYLNLTEYHIFGLTFIHDGEHFFIDPETKLSKVAPQQWKEPGKGRTPLPFTTYFRVKFYVDQINTLKQPLSRHLFYLQLRKDLLEERSHCDVEEALRLATFAMQAEYGDWWEKSENMCPEHYVPARILRQIGNAYAKDTLTEKHKEHCGMSDTQAEWAFLKEMQRLPEYGIHFYKVFKNKKDFNHGVWTGISVLGVLMAEWTESGQSRLVTHRHPWHYTQKVSFNRRRFSILPKSDMGPMKLPKLNYYTDSYRKGRYLVQMCVAHHRFQLLTRIKTESKTEDTSEGESALTVEMVTTLETDFGDTRAGSPGVVDHSDQQPSYCPPRAPHDDSFEDYSDEEHKFAFPNEAHRGRSAARNRQSLQRAIEETGFNSGLEDARSDTEDYNLDRNLSGFLSPKLEHRRVLVVDLEKEVNLGIGITVVGGEKAGKLDLGIFVKDVIPGGPADRDGRVRQGDRIIAVNGQSLEGMPHSKAVDLIRDSPDRVQLMLSQAVIQTLSRDYTAADAEHGEDDRSTLKNAYSDDECADEMRPAVLPIGIRRSASVDSSDLELEDVIPPEALHRPLGQISAGQLQNLDAPSAVSDQKHSETSTFSDRAGEACKDRHQPSGKIQPGDKYEVVLQKTHKGIGLNVAGGVNTNAAFGGIYVKSLTDGGAAQQDPRILVGDQVLEVSGVSLTGITHKQAVGILRRAPALCKLLMRRRKASRPTTLHSPRSQEDEFSPRSDLSRNYAGMFPGEDASSPSDAQSPLETEEGTPMDIDYPFVNKHNTFEVVVENTSSDLGFSATAKKFFIWGFSQRLICVSNISNTLVTQAGSLQEGDIILKINKQKVKTISYKEVLKLLDCTQKEIRLLICRPKKDILSSYERASTSIDASEQSLFDRNLSGTQRNSLSADCYLTDTFSSPDHILPDTYREKVCDTTSLSPYSHHSHTAPVSNSVPLKSRSDHSVDLVDTQRPDDAIFPSNNRQKLTDLYSVDDNLPFQVRSFLKDAGLESPDSSTPHTPSSERKPSHEATTSGNQASNRESEEYDVTLTKGDRGFGFTVIGGRGRTGYLYIKDVLHDPALSNATIHLGDRLLVLNGEDLTDMTNVEAMEYLCRVPNTVTIKLSRNRSEKDEAQCCEGETATNVQTVKGKVTPQKPARKKSPPGSSNHKRTEKSNIATPSKDLGERQDRLGSNNIHNEEKKNEKIILATDDACSPKGTTLLITFTKPKGESLGFSLKREKTGSSLVLIVRNIKPGGAVERDGRLMIGDRLVEVNGQSVTNLLYNEVVALIQNAQDTIALTVNRKSLPVSEVDTSKIDSITESVASYTDNKVSSPSKTPADSKKQQSTHATDTRKYTIGCSSESDDNECIVISASPENTMKYNYATENSHFNANLQSVCSARIDGNNSTEVYKTESEAHGIDNTEKHLDKAVIQHADISTTEDSGVNELPVNINNSWVESRPLVKLPTHSTFYSDKQLYNIIRRLKQQLDRGEYIQEFKDLRPVKLTDNCLVGRKQENKAKNRFRNVIPYDATRVCLSDPEDYINASHLQYNVGQETLSYIATQGPLPHTTDDFWRMVWEQKADVIAMMTQDTEGSKVKCQRYWPDSVNDPFVVFNRLEICLTQRHILDNFEIGVLKMKELPSGAVHHLTHLKFTSWPEQGSPTTAVPLVQYVQLMRLVHKSGPVVVHCSAGIGRTGALITLDIVLTLIERDMKFNVHKIVQELRRQRQGMIQTKDQYQFTYMACLEALESLQ